MEIDSVPLFKLAVSHKSEFRKYFSVSVTLLTIAEMKRKNYKVATVLDWFWMLLCLSFTNILDWCPDP